MDINELTSIVKKKIKDQVKIQNIIIEDKTFLHKNHSGYKKGKFHLKISIESSDLKKLKSLESNKKIYKILGEEMKTFIHSLQISIT